MAEFPIGNHRCKRHLSLPRQAYLLTAVTQGRLPIFKNLEAGRRLVCHLRGAQAQGWVESLAFVVMPDHLHWLILLSGDLTLGALMMRFRGHSSREIPGLRWQRGFDDQALGGEEEWLPVARHIIAKPLRAGLVKRVGDYPLWDAVWL